MNNVSVLFSVIKKDMQEFFRNKTIVIVILLPLLASLFFLVIEDAGLNKEFKIGLIDQQKSDFKSYVDQNIVNLNIINFNEIEQAMQSIGSNLDGVIEIEDQNNFKIFRCS